MLDFLRSGQREASPKTLRRLIEAERAAGILPAEPVAEPVEPPPGDSKGEAISAGDQGKMDRMMEQLMVLQGQISELSKKIDGLERDRKRK